MKKICFHIQKGGVGKTSVTGNVAALLSMEGKRTLLVDCDPQANLTSWFCPQRPARDLAGVLRDGAAPEAAILPLSPSLSILPTLSAGGGLKKWAEADLARNPRAFEFLVSDIESLGFEYVLFDCSPSLSLLERSVLACMDEIANPLSPEFFSIDGIEGFANELGDIERANRRKIRNDKIVVNLLNRSFSRHRAFLDELQKLKYRVFVIPQDGKIAECQIAHRSLADFEPRAKSMPFFAELVGALS